MLEIIRKTQAGEPANPEKNYPAMFDQWRRALDSLGRPTNDFSGPLVAEVDKKIRESVEKMDLGLQRDMAYQNAHIDAIMQLIRGSFSQFREASKDQIAAALRWDRLPDPPPDGSPY